MSNQSILPPHNKKKVVDVRLVKMVHRTSSRQIHMEIEEGKKVFKHLYNTIKNAINDGQACEECNRLLNPLIQSPELARNIRKSRIIEEINEFTYDEFPVHLACKRGFPETLKLLFSLGGWSNLSDENDINGKTPLFHLFAPENIKETTSANMETRLTILISLFVLGVSIKREDKNNQNIFNYLKENKMESHCSLIIRAIAKRIIQGGKNSLRDQSKRHVIEHIRSTARNLESDNNEVGIWKSFGDYCQIYYTTHSSSQVELLKRPWNPWRVCIRLEGKNKKENRVAKRLSRRFSSDSIRSRSRTSSRSASFKSFDSLKLGDDSNENLQNSILWNTSINNFDIMEPDVLFEFLDENNSTIVYKDTTRLAESAYIYKIFDREHSNDIESIVNEIHEFNNKILNVKKLDLIHTYYQAYMAMAFHYHQYQLRNHRGELESNVLHKLSKGKLNEVVNDTFSKFH
jgi:hypothetical protein